MWIEIRPCKGYKEASTTQPHRIVEYIRKKRDHGGHRVWRDAAEGREPPPPLGREPPPLGREEDRRRWGGKKPAAVKTFSWSDAAGRGSPWSGPVSRGCFLRRTFSACTCWSDSWSGNCGWPDRDAGASGQRRSVPRTNHSTNLKTQTDNFFLPFLTKISS